MKITLENVTTPINGKIPLLEILRQTGVDIGKVGSRKYKSWSIKHDGQQHFGVESPHYSEYEFSVFDVNLDINAYRDHGDGKAELVPTDNQHLISRKINLYEFEINETLL